jgi:lipoprotein-anchoring transpeptidase ErfK/SrfK
MRLEEAGMMPVTIKTLTFAALLQVGVFAFATGASAQVGPRGGPGAVMDIDEQPGLTAPDDDVAQLDPQFRHQPVYFRTTEKPGTIVIHTNERFLYLVQGDNRAMRYGIGVGRDGFQWSGLKTIERKAEWPDWTPPSEMIQRQPYLPRFMAGGPGNPMGARALYIGGTVYRIHGTNQPQTIGYAVSSGCFRLVNSEIIDLYSRVPVGTKVVVRQQAAL